MRDLGGSEVRDVRAELYNLYHGINWFKNHRNTQRPPLGLCLLAGRGEGWRSVMGGSREGG